MYSLYSAQYKDAIVDQGGIEAIVSAMSSLPADAALQEAGAGALRNLAFGNGTCHGGHLRTTEATELSPHSVSATVIVHRRRVAYVHGYGGGGNAGRGSADKRVSLAKWKPTAAHAGETQ